MKNNNNPSLFFSPFPLKAVKEEASPKSSIQSPYLRAVLSDKRTSENGRVVSLGYTSMAAALRYISKK